MTPPPPSAREMRARLIKQQQKRQNGGWCWTAARRVQAWMVRVVDPGCRVDGRTTCDRRAHRIASDGRLPSAATRSRATAEGQERDLEEGFTDPQRRPQGDQGRCAGCVSAHSTRLSHSVTFHRVCLRWRRQSTLLQARPKDVAAQPGRCLLWQLEKELDHTG